MNRRTSWTVSSSWPTPRCDSVSHCSGISTPSAAVSAATVSTPERGRAVEQHPVVRRGSSARSSSAPLSTCSRPVRVSRSASARASSMVAGSRSTPSSVSMIDLGRRRGPWSARGGSTARGPRGRCRARTSGRPAGRGRRAAPRCPSSASAAPSEATVVVLATPPFWLATASVVVIEAPSCRTDSAGARRPRFAAARMSSTASPAPYRPRHRPHRRHRPRRSPTSSPSAATTWCWSPATHERLEALADELRATYGVAGRGAGRRPRPTATELALVEARLADASTGRSTCWSTTPASGSSGGSSTTPSSRSRPCSTCWSPPCCGSRHAALGADGRARARRHHQRLQRRGVPAARHATAPRRRGSPASARGPRSEYRAAGRHA